MRERDQQSEILQRLHSARGHLDAVIEMAESGRLCEELLYQLNAVQAALRAAGIRLITRQAQDSKAVILGSSSPEERLSELMRLQALYRILMRHFVSKREVSL